MMPNLAPMNQQQRKLKDNWFSLVPNPDDPEDKAPCIQILEGPFHHVIVRYKNFQLHKKLNEDGSINCDFEYDILMAPSTIGENHLTDEQGQIFEEKLGESILELLMESVLDENRNDNIEESVTE